MGVSPYGERVDSFCFSWVGKDCVLQGRMVSNEVLRVRAIRTESRSCPAQRRRADCPCLPGKRKPSS